MVIRPITEECDRCDMETTHEVRIEILEKGSRSKQVVYSRGPYRITVCQRCGTEREQRVND